MSAAGYILLLRDRASRAAVVDPRGVRWADCDFDRDAPANEQAKRIAESLRQLNYRGEPLLLALPASMCLSATIAMSGLSPRDRSAMAFRLEEQLPIAAEEFVCDFISHDANALGIAAPIAQLKPFVAALSEEGVNIASISPFALLAAGRTGGDDRACLVAEGDSLNVIAFRSGRPRSWSLVTNDPSSVKLTLDILQAQDPDLIESPQVADDRAVQAGTDILVGRQHPWIELRRDALAPQDRLAGFRGPINALLSAAAVMFLALSIAAAVRAGRYERAANNADAQLTSAFHSVYPDWTPSNIPAVIESEHRKLSAAAPAKAPADTRHSALRTLHDVIAAMPGGKSFNIDRMTFDDAMFELEGRAGSLGDVDALADATRVTGMTVAPPQSRRDEAGRWSFTIRGSKQPAAASVAQETR